MAQVTDDFESYAVAGLSGDNGGTGWSGAYNTCDVAWDVVSTPVNGGVRAAHASGDNKACQRSFTTSVTTDNSTFEVYMRSDATNARLRGAWQDSAFNDGVQTLLSAAGQIQIVDNLTATNIQAYSANTWYQVTIKVDSFSSKTFKISVNGGAYSVSYAWQNQANAYTKIDKWAFDHQDNANNGYLDDVTVSLPPAGMNLMPMLGVG